jgi:hypothetical protein
MKYEWKKNDKKIYLPKEKPELIDVPAFKYFTIMGQGNPNGQEFNLAIEALYALSYTLKMLPKKGVLIDDYYEYTVFPLEGVWDLTEKGRLSKVLNKDELVYTIMIRQPDFVTDKLANEVINIVKEKKNNPMLDKVKFETITEGLCLQMLHVGSYDNENITFDIMEKYCDNNNLIRLSKVHKEIYISDPRKTKSTKLKTVLRFKVENK